MNQERRLVTGDLEDPVVTPVIPVEQLPVERRNLHVLTIQNLVLRVGWIFKTESVIMPAFLDVIAEAGWIRGFLPVLSRIGQSIPPLLYAERLRGTKYKKIPLATSALGMAAPFLILSATWYLLEKKQQPWLPPLFLLLYVLFFSATGLNQLAFGTLQGKVIRPTNRGWLMGIGGILGSVAAVIAALILLKPWLVIPNNEGFTYVFLFNGLAFLVSGVVSLLCVEIADEARPRQPIAYLSPFRNAWHLYWQDDRFRRAGNVAMLFICSLLIFPHYQWLGREKVGTGNADLINWVVMQNISAGGMSFLLGMIADRYGNRLAIRLSIITVAFTPLVAIAMAHDVIPHARDWYWITFVLLGLTPVIMKTILNYTLELTDTSNHPQYLSTMRVCFAVPFVFSPVIGLMIDYFPFEYTFFGVSLIIFTGGFFTFFMAEPRHNLSDI